MFTCRDAACGHEDMVHDQFAGCCLVRDCTCRGMDGSGPFCTPEVHAAEHGHFTVRPEPKTELEYLERRYAQTVTPEQRARIIALKNQGDGHRTIMAAVDLARPIVRHIIQQEFGRGPGALPRTRPRQEDRQRALDAGITAEEFQAERVTGGRAHTINTLNVWIAERTAA